MRNEQQRRQKERNFVSRPNWIQGSVVRLKKVFVVRQTTWIRSKVTDRSAPHLRRVTWRSRHNVLSVRRCPQRITSENSFVNGIQGRRRQRVELVVTHTPKENTQHLSLWKRHGTKYETKWGKCCHLFYSQINFATTTKTALKQF